MRNKAVLLGFIGPEIDQAAKIVEIQDGFECWNLKRFSFADFVQMLKAKIRPVNNNVLPHYQLETESADIYGLTEKRFDECSWGILIPNTLDDVVVDGYAETLFLLNLYSPTFLYPAFWASDFGITRHEIKRNPLEYSYSQNQAKFFCTKEFVSFFKLLLPQSQYGVWQLYRVQTWQAEDWRLFVAVLLFLGLRDYDNQKDTFGWQREAADMAAILEALFTAEDVTRLNISNRLRKRVGVLLSGLFPSIEDEIKELYEQRSSFVHGRFFARIAQDSQAVFNNLPIPDFSFLYKNKEYVRLALAAYLYLAYLLKSQPAYFGNYQSVMDMLGKSKKNAKLRQIISSEAQKVLMLIPTAMRASSP